MTSQEKRLVKIITATLEEYGMPKFNDNIPAIEVIRLVKESLTLYTPTMSEENSPELCWDKSHNRTYQKCSDCNKPIADYFVKALSGKIAKPELISDCCNSNVFMVGQNEVVYICGECGKTCGWHKTSLAKPKPKECGHGIVRLICKECGQELIATSEPPKPESCKHDWEYTSPPHKNQRCIICGGTRIECDHEWWGASSEVNFTECKKCGILKWEAKPTIEPLIKTDFGNPAVSPLPHTIEDIVRGLNKIWEFLNR